MNITRTIAITAAGVAGLAALALSSAAGTAEAATGGMDHASSTIEFGTTQDIFNLAHSIGPTATITNDSGLLTFQGPAQTLTIDANTLDSWHFQSSHLEVVGVVALSNTVLGASDHNAFFEAGVALKILDMSHAGPTGSDWAAIQDDVSPGEWDALHEGFNSPL